jgi:hypothetical protein
MVCLRESFPLLKTRRLSRVEWCKIRRMMGKPRRCSQAFFAEERLELARKRHKIRLLQQRKQRTEEMSTFKDLPDDIPIQLTIGARVTARFVSKAKTGDIISLAKRILSLADSANPRTASSLAQSTPTTPQTARTASRLTAPASALTPFRTLRCSPPQSPRRCPSRRLPTGPSRAQFRSRRRRRAARSPHRRRCRPSNTDCTHLG